MTLPALQNLVSSSRLGCVICTLKTKLVNVLNLSLKLIATPCRLKMEKWGFILKVCICFNKQGVQFYVSKNKTKNKATFFRFDIRLAFCLLSQRSVKIMTKFSLLRNLPQSTIFSTINTLNLETTLYRRGIAGNMYYSDCTPQDLFAIAGSFQVGNLWEVLTSTYLTK